MNNTAFIVVLGLLTLGQTMPSVPSISLAETAQGPEAMLFSTVGFQSEPLEIERIIPTSLVKFHLKEGHIDKMVVTLPQ